MKERDERGQGTKMELCFLPAAIVRGVMVGLRGRSESNLRHTRTSWFTKTEKGEKKRLEGRAREGTIRDVFTSAGGPEISRYPFVAGASIATGFWPDGGPQSLRSPCGLAISKNLRSVE
ncbi:hypothetical protein PoB_007222800 [Plakobranchus ocellatus]|uniref:Uncharacterized protein n=1 Tax=Plakobranchus ocellatus TaxID=259542 RepID=A0AAV4DN30_9GAST|nr:hypothetical protein PoB_007222800 [Plakobranchus ocellatus]